MALKYCGRLGKVANCQAGMFLAYVSPRGRALVDKRLYLPESWTSDRGRWECRREPRCHAPTVSVSSGSGKPGTGSRVKWRGQSTTGTWTAANPCVCRATGEPRRDRAQSRGLSLRVQGYLRVGPRCQACRRFILGCAGSPLSYRSFPVVVRVYACVCRVTPKTDGLHHGLPGLSLRVQGYFSHVPRRSYYCRLIPVCAGPPLGDGLVVQELLVDSCVCRATS